MFKGMKNKISGSISPSRKHIGHLLDDIRGRCNSFSKNRSREGQEKLQDFPTLLVMWGMEEKDIKPVIKELKLRCIILLLLPIISIIIAIWQFTLVTFIAAILILIPCLFALISTAWRISILQKRCFVSFAWWLLGFLNIIQKSA